MRNLKLFRGPSFYMYLYMVKGFPGGASDEEPTCQCRRCTRHGFNPWVGKIPWRRKWLPSPGSLPGKSHGQRSLVGYSCIGLQTVRHDWEKNTYMVSFSHLTFIQSVLKFHNLLWCDSCPPTPAPRPILYRGHSESFQSSSPPPSVLDIFFFIFIYLFIFFICSEFCHTLE